MESYLGLIEGSVLGYMQDCKEDSMHSCRTSSEESWCSASLIYDIPDKKNPNPGVTQLPKRQAVILILAQNWPYLLVFTDSWTLV